MCCGLSSKMFVHKIVNIYLPMGLNIYVLGAQKNRLIETVLLSTNNICFGQEIRKIIFKYALLSGGLKYVQTYSQDQQ